MTLAPTHPLKKPKRLWRKERNAYLMLFSSFRLQQTSFDKKFFMLYLKGYMKKIKEYLAKNNPERVDAFQKEASEFVKGVLAKFDDYEFYTGESMDPDGFVGAYSCHFTTLIVLCLRSPADSMNRYFYSALGLLNYREDGITPYLTFFRDGLKEERL